MVHVWLQMSRARRATSGARAGSALQNNIMYSFVVWEGNDWVTIKNCSALTKDRDNESIWTVLK